MTNNYQKEVPGRRSFKRNDLSNCNSQVRLIISFKHLNCQNQLIMTGEKGIKYMVTIHEYNNIVPEF